ncbi:hypothetical protein V2J09_017617 [Rumex salicifolius]
MRLEKMTIKGLRKEENPWLLSLGHQIRLLLEVIQSCKEKGLESLKKSSLFKKAKKKKYSFDDDDVQGIFEELMPSYFLVPLEPKRPNEVAKTNGAIYCPYHRIIIHSIKDFYVLIDIIERMVNNGEIAIEEEASKSHVASGRGVETLPSNPSPPRAFETIVEANEKEGIPMASLPPMAIPVQFMIDDEVQIVWAYPDIPRDGPRQPTLYEIMMCSNI